MNKISSLHSYLESVTPIGISEVFYHLLKAYIMGLIFQHQEGNIFKRYFNNSLNIFVLNLLKKLYLRNTVFCYK